MGKNLEAVVEKEEKKKSGNKSKHKQGSPHKKEKAITNSRKKQSMIYCESVEHINQKPKQEKDEKEGRHEKSGTELQKGRQHGTRVLVPPTKTLVEGRGDGGGLRGRACKKRATMAGGNKT